LECPDVNLRDPIKAIEDAKRVCQLDNRAHSDTLETLASAYAAAGQFEEAVQCQKSVIRALAADTPHGTRQRQEKKLRLYRSGQAYHGQALSGPTLVAQYRFEESKEGLALDASENGLHGRFTGDACLVDDPERGKVLSLDGDGDWVDCGDHPEFDMTEENTLSLWVKLGEYTGNFQGFIGKGDSTWRIARDDWTSGVLQFTAGPGLHKVVGHVGVDDDKWHHIAGVYNGSILKLYLDGRLDSSVLQTGRMTPNESPVLIGAVLAGSEHTPSKGLIDDVCIYNYALDANAVTALYQGLGPK
jgi:hypothetical protein